MFIIEIVLINKFTSLCFSHYKIRKNKLDELESAEQALEEVVRLDPANTRAQAQLERIREELDREISQ